MRVSHLTLCVVALSLSLAGLATSRYVDPQDLEGRTVADDLDYDGGMDHAFLKAATSTSNSTSHDSDHGSHGFKKETYLLAPFMILTGGVLVKVALAKVPLPYTAILLLLGLALGVGLRQLDKGKWNDSLATSSAYLSGFDAHLLLFMFLPPLLFESASQMEWHLCWSSKSYILMLAGPGVLCATFMTGVFLNEIIRGIGYDGYGSDGHGGYKSHCEKGWKDIDGYLLGVILSATDPVAVVALLAELGAKKSLATNIEGESLLNDGTAYVLFLILQEFAENPDHEAELEDHMIVFVKMAIGGVLFGYVCGVMMMEVLTMIINDSIAEITTTVVFAWLCFFVAEFYLGISGVLAVVAMGLQFGYVGKNTVSADVWHTMEEFWEMMTFFANTLVFVVAGMIIGHKSEAPNGAAFVHLFLSYLSITFVRSVVTWSVYFFLTYLGKELDWKDQVIGIWGGLRGAVGLALAMIVSHSDKMCEDTTNKIMYHTAGVVLLTVCFNAPTLPIIMKALNMTAVSKSKKIVFQHSIDTVNDAAKMKENDLKLNPMFDRVEWNEIKKYYVEAPPGYDLDPEELAGEGWSDVEARMRVLMVCKECYTRANREGQLSTSAALKLKHITDCMLDKEDCPLDEWNEVALWVGAVKPEEFEIVYVDKGEKGYQQQQVLKVLDHPAVVIFILFIVFAATVCSFSLPNEKSLDYIFCAIFFVEVSVRCLAIGTKDGIMAIKKDHYTMLDITLTSLDIILIALGDLVGNANDFARLFRFFRFLRLARLLRLARFAKMAKAKASKKKQEILQNKSVLFDDEKEASNFSEWVTKIFVNLKKYIVMKQVEKEYQTVMGFLHAREEAHEMLGEMLQTMASDGHNPIEERIHQDLKAATEVIRGYQGTYSELAGKVTSKMAAYIILNTQNHVIHELAHHGMLEGTEWEKMDHSVSEKLFQLQWNPPKLQKATRATMIKDLFSSMHLTEDLESSLAKCIHDEMHQESVILQEEGTPLDEWVYFLGRGIATISQVIDGVEVEMEERSGGEMLPALKLVGADRSDITIKTTGPSLLFKVQLKDILKMMDESKFFTLQIWNQLAWSMCCYQKRRKELDAGENMLLKEIRGLFQKFGLFFIEKDDTVKLGLDDESTAKLEIFFSGKGSITYNGTTVSEPGFVDIEPSALEFKATAKTVFLADKKVVKSHKEWNPDPTHVELDVGKAAKDKRAIGGRATMIKSPKPSAAAAMLSPKGVGLDGL